MKKSESISELAAAMARAQGAIEGAKKDRENPHFRSKYADLASIWDACRAALAANGLSVVQFPQPITISDGYAVVEVETTLLHASGQWMAGTLSLPVSKADAQGVGSAITYARRYALAAVVGVAPDDDDGNAASAGGAVAVVPKGYSAFQAEMIDAAAKGLDALSATFKAAPKPVRDYATGQDRLWLSDLKKLAGGDQ